MLAYDPDKLITVFLVRVWILLQLLQEPRLELLLISVVRIQGINHLVLIDAPDGGIYHVRLDELHLEPITELTCGFSLLLL